MAARKGCIHMECINHFPTSKHSAIGLYKANYETRKPIPFKQKEITSEYENEIKRFV